MTSLAWGRRVVPAFRYRVLAIAAQLAGATASDVMACIAQESNCTFSPSVRNEAGSGAVGLLQFMPSTAAMLGTTTEALSVMTALEQLDYVEAYLRPAAHRLRNLGDLYCWILWPAGVGQPDTAPLFTKGGPHPKLYLENAGLDFNHNGIITRGEVTQRVTSLLAQGLLPANAA